MSGRRIAPFRPGDMAGMEINPAQLHAGATEPAEAAELLSGAGSAFTLRDGAGHVLLVAGLARIDDGHAHGWAFMAARAGPHLVWLTRKVKRYLDAKMASGHRRIEIAVSAGFADGQRWAFLLGFVAEGVMHRAAPDGGDLIRWARWTERTPALELAA